ncbi:phage portal protein [Devosia sp. J2-20]|uniref:phage portal protein n=1 Tax=Devosia sp. J2-20 TaxID=3026161 RepID=UPI00249A8896|nr:phage portal protein [Devosia sp. J2-20]WDQ98179.1 phage portal protein [Devosia sp. J2-20]
MAAAGNFLDRAIGYVSPKRGVQRLARRAMLSELQRSYSGADRGRLRSSWNARSTSANTEIGAASQLLRDRMRDLVRNNPLAANAVAILVTHAIGDGIVPVFKNPKVKKVYEKWAKSCDADGAQDFYGIQALAAREMFEGGDGLVRRKWRRRDGRQAVPLKLQVIEADQIDSRKDGNFEGGLNAIQGIEFDEDGERKAFWLFDQHPGAHLLGKLGLNKSRAVPASDIAHVFEKQRTQVRGVPWGAPVMVNHHDLEGYREAERVRKRLEACLVAIMTGGDPEDSLGTPLQPTVDQPAGIYDAHGQRVDKVSPGTVYNAIGGTDVKFTQPAVTGDYASYIETEEHVVAAGWRMPHFILTGRLDKVNYSSSKVGLEVFKRTISQLQWQIIIPMLCEPIIGWFLEAAYLAGEIDSPDQAYDWVPPRFYSADPARDLKAQIGEVRAGFKPWSAAVAERGEDPEATALQLAEDNKTFDDLGLVLDVDGRKMSQAGQTQQPDDTDNPKKDGEQ